MEKIDYKKGRNMTISEFVAREKKRAEKAYINAMLRTGATDAEIDHHEEQVRLWEQIEKAMRNESTV